MFEIRTVTMLRRKRDQIRKTIRDYERELDQAKADLVHVATCIAIFEAKGKHTELPAYADIQHTLRYAEGIKLCREALESGPKTTRELAAYIIQAKGLNGRDHVVNKVICRKIIHMLRRLAQQGKLVIDGKRQAALIWLLPASQGALY
jgi:hypothetical protein